MHLTPQEPPQEHDKLLIYTAGELAKARRVFWWGVVIVAEGEE